ncbi:MFS transporter [Thioalkalivibrio sulfidiphilus]|uniref:MFS transporter n=1 Tax=Thioalkalivibrio sulfidiphilus TaxID=1033854 RepID=UPI003B30669C
MPLGQLLIIQYCTLLVFSALYTPQPLLPVLAEHFGVGEARASLLITVTLLPLAVAPIAYGFLLQKMAARRLLLVSIWLLAASQVVVYFVDRFDVLLGLRLLQGMVIPAMLTGLMTYLGASAGPGRIAQVMAAYVASTVMGGFLGRALSGVIAANFGWRWPFLLLGLATVIAALLLSRLKSDPPVSFQRLRLSAVIEILRQPSFLKIYGVVFCAFGAFASLLNFLPFRLVELGTGMSESGIGLMYSGYLMGVVVSLISLRLASRIGGTVNAMLVGTLILVTALLFFAASPVWVMFLGMFVLCSGMFMIHSLAPGVLNQQSGEHRGVVNGLYIAFYYAGGAIGSFLPGFLYHGFGWYVYLGSLALVVGLAGSLLWGLRR